MAPHGPSPAPAGTPRLALRWVVTAAVFGSAASVGFVTALLASGGLAVSLVQVVVSALALAVLVPLGLQRAGLLRTAGDLAADEEVAIKDPLTGLLNHAAFSERVGVELRRGQREGYRVAIVAIDIDHFQQINDGWGHAVGDEALKLVAQHIVTELRPSDIVGRIGGDQFMLALIQTGGRHGVDVVNRVRTGVASIAFNPTKQPITVSAGVALFPYDATEVEVLMRHAEDALRRSKASGRNRSTAYADMAEEPTPVAIQRSLNP